MSKNVMRLFLLKFAEPALSPIVQRGSTVYLRERFFFSDRFAQEASTAVCQDGVRRNDDGDSWRGYLLLVLLVRVDLSGKPRVQ
jgi:hypothetical protein